MFIGVSVDERAVVGRGQRDGPVEQADAVVGPDLDGREAAAVYVQQPRPSAVVKAHQVVAVGLVPGEFLLWVLRAPSRLAEVVADARVLGALDDERVTPGTCARGVLIQLVAGILVTATGMVTVRRLSAVCSAGTSVLAASSTAGLTAHQIPTDLVEYILRVGLRRRLFGAAQQR